MTHKSFLLQVIQTETYAKTNSITHAAAKTFSDDVDTDGNSSDDEEEIVLLSPGRQSSSSIRSHDMATFGASTNTRSMVNGQNNQQLHQQNGQSYFNGQKNEHDEGQ